MIQARDLRLVHGDTAEQFDAMGTCVRNLQGRISLQAVLQARIQLLSVWSPRITINYSCRHRTAGLNQGKNAVWRCIRERLTEWLSGSIRIQEKWRRKISERQVGERWARIKDTVASTEGESCRTQWGPRQPDPRPKIVRVNAVHHALANSGHAGQAISRKRIPRFDNAGGWRPKRKSIAVHRHLRPIERRIEAADAALRIVWRQIQFVSQSQV